MYNSSLYDLKSLKNLCNYYKLYFYILILIDYNFIFLFKLEVSKNDKIKNFHEHY